ncbi:cation transporter [Streptomyces sp. NPDC002055]|uniref:cation transporter n=1 Tax=Streptomyces sp. NPDC002055 TaxID=3154534 RepID=UPI003321F47D
MGRVEQDHRTPDGAGPSQRGGSLATVIVAALAGLGIAVAKAVAGAVSGSGALLAEAAHSVADAVTGLLTAFEARRERPAEAARPDGHDDERRHGGERRHDEEHRHGGERGHGDEHRHGNEPHIPAALGTVALFVAAAVFALDEGIRTLAAGGEPGDPAVAYVVLAVALLPAAWSLRAAVRQVRAGAARFRVPVRDYLRHTPDTAERSAVLRDAAAVAGLLLAAAGLLGGRLTGSAGWDGAASVLIGLLLLTVAWESARGRPATPAGGSLPPEMRDAVRDELLELSHVLGVLELVTVVQGPGEVLVAAKVDFTDYATAEEIEWACEDAERALRTRFPAIARVFLDPTPGPYQRRPER